MELPRDVAVVGAGTMGAGIARVFADAGASVRLCARREASLEAARGRLGDAAARVRLTTSADEALDGAGLVIETIVEEAEPKRAVLARAEELAAPDAVLTTNTSSLPLAALGGALRQPERFAGLHWLNPPELVELVEVVGGERTAPGTLETLASWMEELGKAPVIVRRDVPGFVANRLQYASCGRPTRSSTRRLLVRRRGSHPHARARGAVGGDRTVRDDGSRRARRPRGGCSEPLAGARERDGALAGDRARPRVGRAGGEKRARPARRLLRGGGGRARPAPRAGATGRP